MIVHLILNSILVFFCLALTSEILLFLLNVKNFRIQLACRSLPFLKVPFDIFIFFLYGDSLFYNFNPFSCEVYAYDWIASFFPLIAPEKSHLIIPQYLASQLSNFWLTILTITVCIIAVWGMVRKLHYLWQSKENLRMILANATSLQLSLHNQKLQRSLKKWGAELLISSKIDTPFAAYPRYILIPNTLIQTLAQDEIEAVIAHELQHIKWRDPLLKFFYSLICSLCWWIPSDRWLNRLIDTQEQASDASVLHDGIDQLSLASAMTKILRDASGKEYNTMNRCFFGSTKSSHKKRLELLLDQDKNKDFHSREWLALILSIVTFLSFWMC